MSDVTAEELLSLLHEYYPTGPAEKADAPASGPEFQRWRDVWHKALEETRPWSAVFQGLRPLFPGQEVATLTQPYHASCFVCGLRLRMPMTEGMEDQRIVRVAGAVSLLAPVYLVYGTIEVPQPPSDERRRRTTRRTMKPVARPGGAEPRAERPPQEPVPGPELFLQPTEEMRATAEVLARHLGDTLGFRRFPPELAGVRVPGIRVPYLGSEEPTLLNALFKPGLEHL